MQNLLHGLAVLWVKAARPSIICCCGLIPFLMAAASSQDGRSVIPPADSPARPSPVIREIRWAPKETIIRKAQGGDNWPITWADDDALYTAYGDGNGFEPFTPEKLSMGFARIIGGPADFYFETKNTKEASKFLKSKLREYPENPVIKIDQYYFLKNNEKEKEAQTALAVPPFCRPGRTTTALAMSSFTSIRPIATTPTMRPTAWYWRAPIKAGCAIAPPMSSLRASMLTTGRFG
ncbi:MAG: hypothetical protein NTW03_14325 [Verrucomicrobia bacterium]|nr:hypothetical protein [Verrucomicrobiota bacterium]